MVDIWHASTIATGRYQLVGRGCPGGASCDTRNPPSRTSPPRDKKPADVARGSVAGFGQD